MQALTYVEIDVDYCALRYGIAPCTAQIPVTGTKKCYNTKSTCQDRLHFTNAPVTLRFSMGGRAYEPNTIDAIPCIVGIDHSPGAISLGGDLGERASVTVTLKEFRHNDTGPESDKYAADRGFDPFKQGSYFAKFRTRNRYLRGKPLRIIRGEVGQPLSAMDTRSYVVDSFSGPDANGGFTIVAKDVLKLADNDRAQAPVASNGRLGAPLLAASTSTTLIPSGVGNAEYPVSGYVAIAGKEVCAFTRSNDTLTLTRAQFGTDAIDHDANDRVQLVLRYAAQDPADILYDLLVNYAGVDPAFIPLSSWQAETAAFIGTLYTANIVEPMGVRDLISEIIEQAALVVWWDDAAQLIRLQVLRAVPANAQIFDETNTLEGSLSIQEQPDKRLSHVLVYYNQRNPCEKHDENNFQSTVLTFDGQRATDYGSLAYKTILSRWIPNGGRAVALRLGDTQLARFKDPPRAFSYSLLRGTYDVSAGGGVRIGSWAMQDDEGLPELANAQITRLKRGDDQIQLNAEEILFDFVDSGGGGSSNDRVIILDVNQNNVNLRTLHDALYPVITTVGAITLTCIIDTGVTIGSNAVNLNAFTVGAFPVELPIKVLVKGRIQGFAGSGGQGSFDFSGATPGQPGGTAFYTRQFVTLDFSQGSPQIWGGGGGGGGGGNPNGAGNHVQGGGGGGGAGTLPGYGGNGSPFFTNNGSGAPGSSTAGGLGFVDSGGNSGGNGGGPGLPGSGGFGLGGVQSNFGAAGTAIDGVSYCTITAGGDVRGPQVN